MVHVEPDARSLHRQRLRVGSYASVESVTTVASPCMVSSTLARGLFAVFVSASSREVKNNSYDRDHCHRWSNGGHGYLPLGPVVAKRASRFAGHSQTQSHPQAKYPHTTLNRESLTAEIAKMPTGRAVAVARRRVLRDRFESGHEA